MKSSVWFLLAVLATSVMSFHLNAAVDMFIKIEGVDGESQSPGHEGEIDVLAWSWGTHHTSRERMNGPARYGRTARNGEMTFTKSMDSTSAPLFSFCSTSQFKDVVILTVERPERPFENYIQIQMHDVHCVAYSVGSGGEDVPTENVTLNFSKIEFEYKPQKADGSDGGNIEMGWDLTKGKKV